jgi:hypothetical protein
VPIKTPTTNPNATLERCKLCLQSSDGAPEHLESLRAELGKLAVQQAEIARQMNEIRATLENCTTCCDNAAILAFINLREQGMIWAETCSALKLKPSTLRAKTNQRFVKVGRRLQEPWAKNLPHRERLTALMRDHNLAALKFSLLADEPFKETVTHLSLPENPGVQSPKRPTILFASEADKLLEKVESQAGCFVSQ